MSGDLTTSRGLLAPVGLDWLRRLVGEELGWLAAQGLPGMPTGSVALPPGPDGQAREADAFLLTCAAWDQAIVTHYRELDPADVPALQAAFARLRAGIVRWPQPAHLFPFFEPRREPTAAELEERERLHAARFQRIEQDLAAQRAARRAEKANLRPERSADPAGFKAGLARLRAVVGLPAQGNE